MRTKEATPAALTEGAGGIVVQNLNKSFAAFQAVKDVTFSAEDCKITALLGPSGSGKSTVLRMIAGLKRPDSGRIVLGGEVQTDKTVQERRFGFMFQHYALFRHMTVRQNVAFGLAVRHESKPKQRERVGELLELVGLSGYGDRYPDQLSGGQRQRVALVRALAPQPKVLLLDEPFGALDARVRQELRRWLDDLHRELGVTSLLVTHDQEEALELANEVVVMHLGQVEQVGTPQEIYNQPATPFVAGFVGAANVIQGHVIEGKVRFGSRDTQVVPGADHLDDGEAAHAFIRTHDVRISTGAGEGPSVPATVERVSNLGWTSKLRLRLADGQHLIAQIPNEELDGVEAGDVVYVELRNAKIFSSPLNGTNGQEDPDGTGTAGTVPSSDGSAVA